MGAGIALDGGGREFVVSMARRDVIQSYERACEAAGVHAGIVDLASFNVVNALLAATGPAAGDWLLVHVAAEDATLAIVRGSDLVFFRHRALGPRRARRSRAPDGDVPRGPARRRRLLARGAGRRVDGGRRAGRAASARHRGTPRRPVELFDVRGAATMRDRISVSPELLDALAAPSVCCCASGPRSARSRAGGVMLRTNLATRPFYNERAAHVALGLVALIVAGLTIANLVSVVRLSRQNTVLGATMREDRTTAAELTRKARQTRQEINQDELKVIVAAAREANALIDGRTFSWTALFNQLESTLPPDVMLSSVRPTIDDNGTKVTMVVVGRRTADLDEFMEKLEATGAFENVLPHQQNLNDEGLTQATIDGMYVPEVEVPPAPSPAPAPPEDAAGDAREDAGAACGAGTPAAKKIASAAGGAR